MVRSEIAVLRFGLGARPGELSSAADDPRGWLRAQIRGAVPRAGDTPLAPCEQFFAGVLAARDEQRGDSEYAELHGELGAARMAASMIGSDGGPEVAVIEATGWDTHANQGGSRGALAQRLAALDNALRALSDGMGPLWPQTAVLVVTEFGRTASVNGTRGTDHGTGACAFLAGGAVRGGRVIADWPGLSRKALLDGRDVRPTLDLRSVFKAVLADHIRIDTRALMARVFPDSQGALPLDGLIRA